MAAMLETPSRIWRRIEAIENRDMPSLPSLPPFEDSGDIGMESNDMLSTSDGELNDIELNDMATAVHSTPAASSHAASTFRTASTSASNTARFARSIAPRSTKPLIGPSAVIPSRVLSASQRKSSLDSFDISRVPSIPKIHTEAGHHSDEVDSDVEDSHHDVYLPVAEDHFEDEDLSISDALQSVSRSSSPAYGYGKERTPIKSYDYSLSLKSEPKPSPIDKFRNISLRRPPSRARTPSLTHTLTSTSSSSTNDTPQSAHGLSASHSNATSPIPGVSIPLPPSRGSSESPAVAAHRPREDVSPVNDEQQSMSQSMQMQSMDITDVQISPPQLGYVNEEQYATTETEDEQNQSMEETDDNFQGLESHEADSNEPTSADEREPTFSSEAEDAEYRIAGGYANRLTFNRTEGRSPAAASVAQSSPAQSVPFTPTPAFPHPRTRFNVPDSSDDLATPRPLANQYQQSETDEEQNLEEQSGDAEQTVYQSQQGQAHFVDDELVTPHSRRRSFLLSVINSTAKPRLKYPTPHPRNVAATPLSTPGVSVVPTPAANFRTAFAGFTPRSRVPSGSSSSSNGGQTISQPAPATTHGSPATEPSDNSVKKPGATRVRWATPGLTGSTSPQVTNENVSFISTASSHDLTTHHRINTSFDPAMGFGAGAPGHGVGRFNAGKLNNYLHSLNRRLQEENEILMEKLRRLQEEKEAFADDTNQERLSAAFSSGGRRSSASRRISGGTVLDDVREDVIAEGWLEEKAELEELVDSYREKVDRISGEKEELDRNLDVERKERERDKQRWKDRMTELEQGVEVVVKDLEQKLEKSEGRAMQVEDERGRQVKNLQRELSEAQNEYVVMLERAERAEHALESEKELGGELKESSERLAMVIGDLRNANIQIQELEEELAQADEKIEALEKALRAEKDTTKGLVEELDKKADALTREKEESRKVEAEARRAEEGAESMKGYVTELEEQMGVAADQIADLESDLIIAKQERQTALSAEKDARQQTERLELDTREAQEFAQHMKNILQDTEDKMVHDQEVMEEFKAKISSLERELEREKERRAEPSRDILAPNEADIQTLEEELDAAGKEIARLNTILNQSPARKAVDKAKDMRIEVLEREKEELLERNRALRTTMTDINTPNKIINGSGISPIHRHVLSMSLRTPRTPGGPLKELSWLNSTSDPTVSPLVAEINRLQRELDHANESIDDKLDKLQDAGLGVIGLTKKLEDARAQITTLEDEISRLSRREDRLIHRMERIRCHKCRVKVDVRAASLADESSIEINTVDFETPNRTSEVLRTELRSVNTQLENLRKQWEDEKRQLVGENAALQSAAERLDEQVRRAQDEARRAYESGKAGDKVRASTEGELERAKRVITDLEDRLKTERASLRALATEQDQLQREKAAVLSQLQRTESDMDDVRQQLHKVKQGNHDLEKELRVNATAEQKARILEGRVTANLETIEQLRHERTLLASDHKQLQRRFTELTEQANQHRSKYSASSTSHEKRRHQLDLYCLEIEDLRRALSEQVDELHRAEKEKHRIAGEKEGVAQTVASLETDLHRVKKDAEVFGRDLRRLRTEKDNMEESHKHELAQLERSKKQAQTQIRLLTEQLESHKDAALRAQEDLRRHSCAANDTQLVNLKLQHNKESKGLIVQIRYLKAKFTRESSLRTNLCYQKQYLLVLLARYEKR
ncbi:hypothetical protein AX15_002860 [Amanita polypyramis BW_CC]|nr:hypothetical protein AX15_002860 [Amanita polypyramis BW_CC]